MSATLEERFALLEAEVARLRAEVEGGRENITGTTKPNFLRTMIGIHANSPTFEEVTRQIELEREREREEVRRLSVGDETSA